ncbi:diguanylate cyclase [Bacteroidetes/Chlorobi group bacterium ChocPot_Mid]|jgi:predicted Fe-Mo cluster-binding NifX family protein|nr:MAG: diguanylate cyclase [Bacteroidetes/Chlorobi group bacterium ChocPot_Mid]
MIICVPTDEPKGLDSMAYGHFGSAPYFIIYNTLTNNYEVVNNGNAVHEHGQCNPVQPLLEKKVEVVVVAGMGARALSNLNSMGIRVYRTIEEKNIKDIISEINNNKMKELTLNDSCGGHHNCN